MKKLVAISLIVVFLMSVSGGAEANPGRELQIVEVSVEVDPANPNRVNVGVTVGNSGDDFIGAFTVRWYAGQDDEEPGCSIEVPGLSAHKRGTARCSYTYQETGTKHWRAVVDEENQITENNENNNTAAGTVVIEGAPSNMPDLTIRDARFEPQPVNPDQQFEAVMTIVNLGDVAVSGPFSALWHFPSRQVQEGDCVFQFRPDLTIGPGSGLEVSCRRTNSPTISSIETQGSQSTMVTVDPDNLITEGVEANNEVEVYLNTRTLSDVQPDLIINEAYFEPAHPVPGEPFTAVMRIRNRGQVHVTEPFSALWHFHAALGLEDCVWQFDEGMAAQTGARLSCTRTSNARAGQSPTTATVDTDNVIAELDEINNDVPVTLVLYAEDTPDPLPAMRGPDLTIRNLEVTPSHAIPGQGLTVAFDVVNIGSEQARASQAFWHSGSDEQQARTWDVPALAKGASHHIEQSGVRAPGTPGLYTHRALADSAAAIDEWSETDNVLIVEDGLQVMATDDPDPQGPPDLIVRNLSVWPNPVNSGQDLLIEYEVVNQGRGTAPASVARWTTPSGAGVSVRCTVPVLEVGQSFRCTQQIPAPSRKGGTGNSAKADVDNVVDEGTGEDNNVLRGEALTVQ